MHPELELENVYHGSRGMDRPRGGPDCRWAALLGLVAGAARISRLDNPPPSPCVVRPVLCGRDCITVRVRLARSRGIRRDNGCGCGRFGREFCFGFPRQLKRQPLILSPASPIKSESAAFHLRRLHDPVHGSSSGRFQPRQSRILFFQPAGNHYDFSSCQPLPSRLE